MPVALTQITKPKLLLGEGVDEVRFYKAYLAHLNVVDNISEALRYAVYVLMGIISSEPPWVRRA